MKAEIIQVLASFVGSFGFAVLYNLRGKKLCMAGISGMVSWIAYLIVWNEMPSTFVANLAAAAVATIYAETMARILKTPVTVFLITGIIPLVPGGNLYYELCLGKTVAFILFIWAKNIADRSGGCGRDHDSIFCLRNLCIRMEILQKRDMSNLRINLTDFA